MLTELGTIDKPVSTCRSVGYDSGQIPFFIEDDAVWPGASTVIFIEVTHDGKLKIGPRDRELEALVVAKGVWIVAGALSLSGLEQLKPFRDGGVDGALEIAYSAAGFRAGLGLTLDCRRRLELGWVERWRGKPFAKCKGWKREHRRGDCDEGGEDL